MRTVVLGSGSRGNALVIECGDTRLLVDAGFPPRILARRLQAAGVPPESIAGVLVTHEHHDHARGAAPGAKRWGWRTLATAGTLAACADIAGATTLRVGRTVTFGAIDVTPVGVPHDAAEPIGLVATDRASGARVGIAYDLGTITDDIRIAFTSLDVLVIEANHDEGMLRAGPYPWSVTQRIASRTGHLSNRAAAEFVRSLARRSLRHVVLAHLSEQCNDPALAISAVRSATARVGWSGTVYAATQDGVCVAAGAEQLSFAF